jgi:hypothetical protein
MYYDITVPQLSKMLRNLNAILDKAAAYAETKKFDVDILLQSRLAPDQFNFIRQIQIACDTAKLGISRLTGKEAPVQPDNEKTLSELKSRVESVVSYLEKFTSKDFVDVSSRRITQSYWDGQHLTGDEYLTQYLLPNFYFHITTAYAILRHNGVDVGKKDYLGKLPLKK